MGQDDNAGSQERRVPVPESERNSEHESPAAEVLTLPEAAQFLRASSDDVLELVNKGALPAEKIGDQWRLSKRAVVDFLRFGPNAYRDLRRFPPPWFFDHPFWEDFFYLLEKRVLSRLPAPEPQPAPGSKQAVSRHFGVFKEDADLDQQLATLRALRKAAGE